MKIGNLVINIKEITYFKVEPLSSLDIRIYIHFKNGSMAWTRTCEFEIEKLTKRIGML